MPRYIYSCATKIDESEVCGAPVKKEPCQTLKVAAVKPGKKKGEKIPERKYVGLGGWRARSTDRGK